MPGSGEDDRTRRKRLIYRSWHTGMKETDLLLGRFADRHVAAMTEDQLDHYEALLANADPDLYNWVTGAVPVPGRFDTDVMRLLRNFKFAS